MRPCRPRPSRHLVGDCRRLQAAGTPGDALSSVFEQTVPADEVIVCHDGLTHGSFPRVVRRSAFGEYSAPTWRAWMPCSGSSRRARVDLQVPGGRQSRCVSSCRAHDVSRTFAIRGPSWPLSMRAPRADLALRRCSGAGVERSEALDIDASNPAVTLVVELVAGDSLPVEHRRRSTPAGAAGGP